MKIRCQEATQRTIIAFSPAVRAQIDRYGGRSHEGAAKVGHYRWKLTNRDACTITLVECQSTSAPFRSCLHGRM